MIKKESSKQMRIIGEVRSNFTKEEIPVSIPMYKGTVETLPLTTEEGMFFPGDLVDIKDGIIVNDQRINTPTKMGERSDGSLFPIFKDPPLVSGILLQINDDGTALVNFPNKNNDSGNLITVQDYY